MFDNVKINSPKAWLLAARPVTLTGAAVPVMLGSAYAWRENPDSETFGWLPMLCCFLFAFLMQIAANLINDYFDGIKGVDNEKRLGPKRAVQQGWISPFAMRIGIGVTLLLASLAGLPLVFCGGYEMLVVGLVCIVFCFLYTTLFAKLALGDLLVLLFFGVIPVCCTWWVISPHPLPFFSGFLQPSPQAESFFEVALTQRFLAPFLLSIACGLVIDTLLIVNNYRDLDNDREVGKVTLVVLIGRKPTEWLFLALPAISVAIVFYLFGFNFLNAIILLLVYYQQQFKQWKALRSPNREMSWNKLLGLTALLNFLFGVLVSMIIIYS